MYHAGSALAVDHNLPCKKRVAILRTIDEVTILVVGIPHLRHLQILPIAKCTPGKTAVEIIRANSFNQEIPAIKSRITIVVGEYD